MNEERRYTLTLTRDELEVVRCFCALGVAWAIKEPPLPVTEERAAQLSHTDAMQTLGGKIRRAYDE